MTDTLVQLFSAVLIGGAIGIERRVRGKDAGLVTNILVCLGATIISMEQRILVERSIALVRESPDLINVVKIDSGRLIAQIISGIGFLGGGVIIQSKGSVKGITTAATLWVVAGIGIVIGSGDLHLAYISGFFVIFALIVFKKVEVFAIDKKKSRKLYIEYYEDSDAYDLIKVNLKENDISIVYSKTIDRLRVDDGTIIKKMYSLNSPKYIHTDGLIEEILEVDGVIKAIKS